MARAFPCSPDREIGGLRLISTASLHLKPRMTLRVLIMHLYAQVSVYLLTTFSILKLPLLSAVCQSYEWHQHLWLRNLTAITLSLSVKRYLSIQYCCNSLYADDINWLSKTMVPVQEWEERLAAEGDKR